MPGASGTGSTLRRDGGTTRPDVEAAHSLQLVPGASMESMDDKTLRRVRRLVERSASVQARSRDLHRWSLDACARAQEAVTMSRQLRAVRGRISPDRPAPPD